MTQITVPDFPSEKEYDVNSASTGPFVVPFAFFVETDVQATVINAAGVVTQLVFSTDFTFNQLDVPSPQEGNGYTGGEITLNVSIGADGDTELRIFRIMTIDRTANYPSTGPFSMPVLNDEQNRVVMMMQALFNNIWQLITGTTTKPSLNMPTGVAPTKPAQGDIWLTATDMFVRVDGKNLSMVSESMAAGGIFTGTIQVTDIEVGHATDTTLSRKSAGVLQIETSELYKEGGTDVAVGDGGTGASDIQSAIDTLTDAASGSFYNLNVLSTDENDNAVWKARNPGIFTNLFGTDSALIVKVSTNVAQDTPTWSLVSASNALEYAGDHGQILAKITFTWKSTRVAQPANSIGLDTFTISTTGGVVAGDPGPFKIYTVNPTGVAVDFVVSGTFVWYVLLDKFEIVGGILKQSSMTNPGSWGTISGSLSAEELQTSQSL